MPSAGCGPARPLNPRARNLRALCARCYNQRTAPEQSPGRKGTAQPLAVRDDDDSPAAAADRRPPSARRPRPGRPRPRRPPPSSADRRRRLARRRVVRAPRLARLEVRPMTIRLALPILDSDRTPERPLARVPPGASVRVPRGRPPRRRRGADRRGGLPGTTTAAAVTVRSRAGGPTTGRRVGFGSRSRTSSRGTGRTRSTICRRGSPGCWAVRRRRPTSGRRICSWSSRRRRFSSSPGSSRSGASGRDGAVDAGPGGAADGDPPVLHPPVDRRRDLAAVKVGRQWRIEPEAVDAYITTRRQDARPVEAAPGVDDAQTRLTFGDDVAAAEVAS